MTEKISAPRKALTGFCAVWGVLLISLFFLPVFRPAEFPAAGAATGGPAASAILSPAFQSVLLLWIIWSVCLFAYALSALGFRLLRPSDAMRHVGRQVGLWLFLLALSFLVFGRLAIWKDGRLVAAGLFLYGIAAVWCLVRGGRKGRWILAGMTIYLALWAEFVARPTRPGDSLRRLLTYGSPGLVPLSGNALAWSYLWRGLRRIGVPFPSREEMAIRLRRGWRQATGDSGSEEAAAWADLLEGRPVSSERRASLEPWSRRSLVWYTEKR